MANQKKSWKRPKPLLVIGGSRQAFDRYCLDRANGRNAPALMAHDIDQLRGATLSGVVLIEGYEHNPVFLERHICELRVVVEQQICHAPLAWYLTQNLVTYE